MSVVRVRIVDMLDDTEQINWPCSDKEKIPQHLSFITLSLTDGCQSSIKISFINRSECVIVSWLKTVAACWVMQLGSTQSIRVRVTHWDSALLVELGESIIFAEFFGCLEGVVAARSKMNQIAICRNGTSKSSEQNSEILELWRFYFMSQPSASIKTLVKWTEKIAVILSRTLVVSFVIYSLAHKTSTSATHPVTGVRLRGRSPSHGEWDWEGDHPVTGSESKIVLNWPRYSRVSVTQQSTWQLNEWFGESLMISFVSAVVKYGLLCSNFNIEVPSLPASSGLPEVTSTPTLGSDLTAVTSFSWLSSLEIKAPCSLLDAVGQ